MYIVNIHSSSVFEKSDSNTNFQDEKRITNTRYPRTSLADPNPSRRARCPGGNLEPKAISGAGSERGRELYYCIDDATGKRVRGLEIRFSIRLQQNLNFPRPWALALMTKTWKVKTSSNNVKLLINSLLGY